MRKIVQLRKKGYKSVYISLHNASFNSQPSKLYFLPQLR